MSVFTQWEDIQNLLKNESEISTIAYKTFLQNLEPVKLIDNKVIIKTENSLERNYINKKYSKILTIAINEVTSESYDVQFIIPEEIDDFLNDTSDTNIEETNNNEKNYLNYEQQNEIKNTNLNSRYTFDTFVVGGNNKLAHAAALAVADSPAEAYNPLFIYGGVGLGKTHLMHSIAHYILEENKNAKVLYVSSEKFTNELINSIRDDKNEEFRQKYRSIDVLLVDDIQFIAGKERTQEEFFHTFNTLHEANKQIIISSDRPPKEIETLEDRLRSRFEWGLIADIQAPDLETRIAILRKKAETEGMIVSDEVILFIAKSIKSNIRELEGALNRIVAFAALANKDIDNTLASEALKDLISKDNNRVITPEYIQEIVASYYGLKKEELCSKKRTRNISFPRQIAMYLSRELTDLSLPKIGEKFGGRDHTTIIHGFDKISTELKSNMELQNTITELTKKIKSN